MSKFETPRPSREELALEKTLLTHAAGQIGYVLRPYPDGTDGPAADLAVQRLRDKGLVHGSRREPNLTMLGIEMTRELAG